MDSIVLRICIEGLLPKIHFLMSLGTLLEFLLGFVSFLAGYSFWTIFSSPHFCSCIWGLFYSSAYIYLWRYLIIFIFNTIFVSYKKIRNKYMIFLKANLSREVEKVRMYWNYLPFFKLFMSTVKWNFWVDLLGRSIKFTGMDSSPKSFIWISHMISSQLRVKVLVLINCNIFIFNFTKCLKVVDFFIFFFLL